MRRMEDSVTKLRKVFLCPIGHQITQICDNKHKMKVFKNALEDEVLKWIHHIMLPLTSL